MVKFRVFCNDEKTSKEVLEELKKNQKNLVKLTEKWSRGKVLNRALRAAKLPPLAASLSWKKWDNTFYVEMNVSGAALLGDKETFRRIKKEWEKDFKNRVVLELLK